MSKSIKEFITENLQQSLAAITMAAGYENDATSEREKVRGNSPVDRHVIVTDDGDTPVTSPITKDDYNASYSISCAVTMTDAESESMIDGELARLVADVRKALMVDWTRGGNAIDTTPGATTTNSEGRSDCMASATLSVTVFYRTAKDDPFTL